MLNNIRYSEHDFSLDALIEKNSCYTFINPYSYLKLRKNKKLLDEFKYLYVDGIFLVLVLRIIGLRVTRASFDMTSLAPLLFNYCIENNKTIYFLGSKPNEIELAISKIKENFENLDIIGYQDGYFKNEIDKNKCIKNIINLKPDFVICGMGTPLQEKFLVLLKDNGYKGGGFTCGGFLHQTAKGINYYPKWMNRLHLRWLYRIIDEPQLIKRYTIDYTRFLFFFLLDYFIYKTARFKSQMQLKREHK